MQNFTAVMTGANMVPPVNAPANGTTLLEFRGSKDNTLDYIVTVNNLVRPCYCLTQRKSVDVLSNPLRSAMQLAAST